MELVYRNVVGVLYSFPSIVGVVVVVDVARLWFTVQTH
jgi:hypothetical protein